VDQVLRLAQLAATINASHIKRGLITVHDVIQTSTVLSDGTNKDVLIPIPDKIRVIRDEIFTTNSAIEPGAIDIDPATLVRDEQSRIIILNGTAQSDLATRTAEYFRAQGLNVIEQTDTGQSQAISSLIIYTGKPYTIKYLSDLMKIPESQIVNKFNPDSPVDIEVVLGNDWANKNPLP